MKHTCMEIVTSITISAFGETKTKYSDQVSELNNEFWYNTKMNWY